MISMNSTEALTQTMPTLEHGRPRLLARIGARSQPDRARRRLPSRRLRHQHPRLRRLGDRGLASRSRCWSWSSASSSGSARVYVFRWTTWIDRRLAGWERGEPIDADLPAPRAARVPGAAAHRHRRPPDLEGPRLAGAQLGRRLRARRSPSLTVTALVLAYILMPAWWWAIPDPSHTSTGRSNFGIFRSTRSAGRSSSPASGLVAGAAGDRCSTAAPSACHAASAARILGPSESQRLRARVEDLAASRAGAVEAAQDQLERIERDLHDGAQARLVALAMELGMAEEELEANPGAARETVRRAREEALAALERAARPLARDAAGAAGGTRARGRGRGAGRSARRCRSRSGWSARSRSCPSRSRPAAYFVVAEALDQRRQAQPRPSGRRCSLERDRGERSR